MSVVVANRPASLMPARGEIAYGAAGVACLALLMTASGAFDTDDLAVSHRYTLWLIVCGLNVGQAILLHAVLARRLPEGFFWGAVAVIIALAATILLMTFELHALKFTPLLPKKPDPLVEFAVFVAPPVSAIAGCALLLQRARVNQWGYRKVSDFPETSNYPRAASNDLSPDSGLSTRTNECFEPSVASFSPQRPILELDNWPTSPVLRVQADDHYLHVVTAQGTSLIRGRMKDALIRLQGVAGLQVHRSHWVTSDAVARAVLRGRDYHVFLKDGTRIPVGRSRIALIREKRWV
jgi:hypothetical protein